MRRVAGTTALAVLGGVLWALCFGRHSFLVAPWVALIPLLLLLGQPRCASLAMVHGLAYWLTSIYWIAPTLETYGQLSGWLSLVLLVLLAAYLALYQGVFGWIGSRLWRAGGWAAVLGLPALWVALEWARAHLLTGFPWNLAAYAWVAVPGALPLAGWIGAYGVSFLVLFANVGWARSVAGGGVRPGVVASLICFLLLGLGSRFSPGGSEDVGASGVPVKILQPNIANLVEWDPVQAGSNYHKLMRLSRQACEGESDALLVWPESAAWPYVFERHEFLRNDLLTLAEGGCSVLLNTVTQAPEGFFNSALVVGKGGVTGRYDKRHLVPFGEFVPLAHWLPFVGRLARNAGDFSAGSEVSLLPWRDERIGAAICFEIIFPGEVAAAVRGGATLLATITNDAWYGDTSAPWQHFRAARFRAGENRRPLLRAAITGVSGVVDADGAVLARLGVSEEGIIARRVAGRDDLSPYTRRPWLVPVICSLLAAFAIFRAAGGRRR